MKVRKVRACSERLENCPPSAIWEILDGYDLHTYVVHPRIGWVVTSGAAESRDDIQISELLAGRCFPTRKAALQAVEATITFLESQGRLDGVREPAED